MDQFYEYLEKVPEQLRYAIVAAVAVVAIALYWFLIRLPAQDQLAALDRKYQEINSTYQEKKAIADDLQNWQLEIQRLEVALEEALNQLPVDIDEEQLLINIPNIAKKNALSVQKFSMEGERRKGTYAEVPMNLELKGTYQGIGSFAQEIGDQPRIMAVKSLTLKRGKTGTAGGEEEQTQQANRDEGVGLDIDAEVVTYRFLESGGGDSGGNQRKRRGRRR